MVKYGQSTAECTDKHLWLTKMYISIETYMSCIYICNCNLVHLQSINNVILNNIQLKW